MTDAITALRRSPRRSDAIGHTAPSLAEQVAERLLRAILDGEIPSGARLPEIALAEEHKVSRATIRDALAQLERHHFVEKLPRFGCRVVSVDMGEIAELYEMRAMLLGLASSRAARLATDEETAELLELTSNLTRLADGDAGASIYQREVFLVQAKLIRMASSNWLADMYQLISNQSLWRVMVRGKNAVFGSKERRQHSAQDWLALAQAVAARDSKASEAAARALIEASWEYVRVTYSPKSRDDVRSSKREE